MTVLKSRVLHGILNKRRYNCYNYKEYYAILNMRVLKSRVFIPYFTVKRYVII